jgi:hypothetical protein
MCVANRVGVGPTSVEAGKGVAPQHCQEQRCYEAVHGAIDIDIAKLAARDADLQNAS